MSKESESHYMHQTGFIFLFYADEESGKVRATIRIGTRAEAEELKKQEFVTSHIRFITNSEARELIDQRLFTYDGRVGQLEGKFEKESRTFEWEWIFPIYLELFPTNHPKKGQPSILEAVFLQKVKQAFPNIRRIKQEVLDPRRDQLRKRGLRPIHPLQGSEFEHSFQREMQHLLYKIARDAVRYRKGDEHARTKGWSGKPSRTWRLPQKYKNEMRPPRRRPASVK